MTPSPVKTPSPAKAAKTAKSAPPPPPMKKHGGAPGNQRLGKLAPKALVGDFDGVTKPKPM